MTCSNGSSLCVVENVLSARRARSHRGWIARVTGPSRGQRNARWSSFPPRRPRPWSAREPLLWQELGQHGPCPVIELVASEPEALVEPEGRVVGFHAEAQPAVTVEGGLSEDGSQQRGADAPASLAGAHSDAELGRLVVDVAVAPSAGGEEAVPDRAEWTGTLASEQSSISSSPPAFEVQGESRRRDGLVDGGPQRSTSTRRAPGTPRYDTSTSPGPPASGRQKAASWSISRRNGRSRSPAGVMLNAASPGSAPAAVPPARLTPRPIC
jgi:hypothetical protein